MRMTILALATLAIALVAGDRPAEARAWYPWCATYHDLSGVTECAFATFQQCLATVSGIGGSCGANPWPPRIDSRGRKRARY